MLAECAKQWDFQRDFFVSVAHVGSVGKFAQKPEPTMVVCCTWKVVIVDRNESTAWYTCPGSFPDDAHICLTTNLQQSSEVSHLRETTTMTNP